MFFSDVRNKFEVFETGTEASVKIAEGLLQEMKLRHRVGFPTGSQRHACWLEAAVLLEVPTCAMPHKKSMTDLISQQKRQMTFTSWCHHIGIYTYEEKWGVGERGLKDGCGSGRTNPFTSHLMQYGEGNHLRDNFTMCFPG